MPRRPLSRLWTDDELKALGDLFNRGMSVRTIACRLRRSPSSVRTKLFQEGHRRLTRRSARAPAVPISGVEAAIH